MKKRIAIACQGGGSHNAFTAGVLRQLLERWSDDHQLVALSGSSGGGVCATLTWVGLLQNDRNLSAQLLDQFWRDNSAGGMFDAWLNFGLVTYVKMMSLWPLPEVTPIGCPTLARTNWDGCWTSTSPLSTCPNGWVPRAPA